ncbi:GDP-mannose 4,6-dehydratase [Paenibacillus cremeus]|uniref:GDP-mannose 4,6-dehydratase n=1 Tax=Paenibacillus cremeus TaxID=2163881 RepID=A0A559KCB8_9BACL|nr:GDP-mannose 4,6-dehydratase [Paenibacillus cremeus]TVY09786.1 GDP-mannose 4,6-dehydratase [Paenibacillus cremeus]
MKALITGATGFVAKYLASHLINKGYEVWGTTRQSSPVLFNSDFIKVYPLELTSKAEVLLLLNTLQPNFIFHLAGQSSVKDSWENKPFTFEANIMMTLNLLEAVKDSVIKETVRVLTVGSSEEYGDVKSDEMPISEKTQLRPISPYGISKATVSMLAQHYHRSYSMKVIHIRPFNHIGPGQSLGFVTSDLAKQIAEIESGILNPLIKVGNLDAKRDFTDVRDIVKAYELIVNFGGFGQIYNVCSNTPVSIQEVLNKLLAMSSFSSIEVIREESKMRPSDFPLYYGDAKLLIQETRWSPIISLNDSLRDILNYWRIQTMETQVKGKQIHD